MKRILIFILVLFIPVVGYSQNRNESEDVKITINLSKISRGVGKAVKAVSDEIKEFKKDIDENMPQEKKDEYKRQFDEIKKNLKDCRTEIHRGFCQGLRGENYDPNKD